MLHDNLAAGEIVDREASLEFMKEATKLATATQLEDVGERLAAKSRRFRALLCADALPALGEPELAEITGSIFSLRRKAGRLVRANGLEALRDGLGALLHGDGPAATRFDRFVGSLAGVEPAMAVSLASETLHFTAPDRYWLWTHWIWNPRTGTGALPLVVREAVDLRGASDGDTYLKVGRALAGVNAEGHAAGFARSAPGLFGTDVFLACVYAVYMYTVFRVKLSQEFNRILPELPELVERVLGVRRKEEPLGAGPKA